MRRDGRDRQQVNQHVFSVRMDWNATSDDSKHDTRREVIA
jgi:hypothetical protein